jgi:hypothetical protein
MFIVSYFLVKIHSLSPFLQKSLAIFLFSFIKIFEKKIKKALKQELCKIIVVATVFRAQFLPLEKKSDQKNIFEFLT